MRKLIRPHLASDPTGLPANRMRRPAPPEVTHAEAAYLRQAVQSRAPFVAVLLGGEEMRGRLLAHDRECLKLQEDAGSAPVLLRKAHVRFYWSERKRGGGDARSGR